MEIDEDAEEADPDRSDRLSPFDDRPASGAFLRVLTKTEQHVLEIYRDKHPGQVFQLNQSPGEFAKYSDTTHLFTLIKNAGLLWCHGLYDGQSQCQPVAVGAGTVKQTL